jgi:hypothetical protein
MWPTSHLKHFWILWIHNEMEQLLPVFLFIALWLGTGKTVACDPPLLPVQRRWDCYDVGCPAFTVDAVSCAAYWLRISPLPSLPLDDKCCLLGVATTETFQIFCSLFAEIWLEDWLCPRLASDLRLLESLVCYFLFLQDFIINFVVIIIIIIQGLGLLTRSETIDLSC